MNNPTMRYYVVDYVTKETFTVGYATPEEAENAAKYLSTFDPYRVFTVEAR